MICGVTGEFGKKVISLDRRGITKKSFNAACLEPGVADGAEVPEMMMRIDHVLDAFVIWSRMSTPCCFQK